MTKSSVVKVSNGGGKGLKPFVCPEIGCGKSFTEGWRLKRHSVSHSGIKPFSCSYPNCSYASGDRTTTIRHIRLVHLKNQEVEGQGGEEEGGGGQVTDPLIYLEINHQDQLD